MAKVAVQPGDQYVKEGTPPTQWTVERILDFPNTPQHVRLVRKRNEATNTRTITVAMSALLDKKFFRAMNKA
ncbi:MAG: hypothetical protein OQK35_04075 [Alphaproteobacteria bacterium]|nr:hypothetical protein [Rhodospirillales bacterium]MCW9045491.1 hypothetical protein [Alphaproteobacteria bacterium]